MNRRTTIVLALALAGVMVMCLASLAGANGATGRVSQGSQVGRGPEIIAPITAGTITAIEQRGHVDNMCQAQAMGQKDIKEHGAAQTFGDYKVAYIVDSPKGWYQTQNGQTVWRAPAPNETAHLEVVVMDALTGKPVPMTGLRMDVLDQQGNVVQSQPLAYYWHPMADHYGANFAIPATGTYTLRVSAPPPDIRRHDKAMGDRFIQPLQASFTGVRIAPMAASASEMGGTMPSSTTATIPSATTPATTGAGPSVVVPNDNTLQTQQNNMPNMQHNDSSCH